MKAVVLKQKGSAEQAFEIQEINTPSIQNSEEVLIKVEAFGLNYADVMARMGLYREAPPMPSVIGYEVVGIVESVGNENNNDLIGKRVVAFTRFGGYAEFAISYTYGLVEIEDMDAGKALSIATQYVTAYYMSHVATNLFPGDNVMIHAGAGGVGTALIQLCKLKGCTVFANAGADNKLEYIKQQGADYAINYRKEDYAEVIKNELKSEKLSCTFNPIGGETFKKDLKLIGAGGKVMMFGGSDLSGSKWGILSQLNFLRKMGRPLPIALMMQSKGYIGVNMLKIGDEKPMLLKHCIEEVTKLVKDGKVNPHVGGRYSVQQIAEAHEFLASRKSIGKIIINW